MNLERGTSNIKQLTEKQIVEATESLGATYPLRRGWRYLPRNKDD